MWFLEETSETMTIYFFMFHCLHEFIPDSASADAQTLVGFHNFLTLVLVLASFTNSPGCLGLTWHARTD